MVETGDWLTPHFNYRDRWEKPILTDGPFAETKEWAAGFWIIEAPDLDVALDLMSEGSKACNRRLEVRPLLQG